MGMRGIFTIRDQLTLEGAYYKVDTVRGGAGGWQVTVAVFASAGDTFKPPLGQVDFDIPYVAGYDPVQLAYHRLPHVKGVPAGMEPVLEPWQTLSTPPEGFNQQQT